MNGNSTSILGLALVALARPCCLLPMLVSLFGLGSTTLLMTLYPYRWLLLASAVMSFAVSAFFTFRQGVSVVTKGVWFIAIVGAVWFWTHSLTTTL
jgi:hypothetical protein